MLKRKISISLRLTVWFGSIFFIGSLLFGSAMWFNLKRTLTGERRQTLSRRLDRLQELLNKDSSAEYADRADDFRDFARATGNGLAEVYLSGGSLAYPSPSAGALSFPWPKALKTDAEDFLSVHYSGQPYWAMSRPVTIHSRMLVLFVAAPEAGNQVVLDSFRHGLLLSLPVLLLIASAGGYWMSRRALQPVDRITRSARLIGIRNLSERLPVPASGDELQRLAEVCNEMLERLESAVKRLKQFTADASHELRGPLSMMRLAAEVALRNPAADKRSRSALTEIVEEVDQASELLNQMLLLARADAEQLGIDMVTIDLVAVIEETFSMASKVAGEKGLQLSVLYPEEPLVEVVGSFPSIRRLLWIILDNAMKYTNAPGQIEISLHRASGVAIVRISDTGCGIAHADLPHIFDRFYRADPFRSQVEGNGLGLSIAKWIANLHHADMTVTTTHGTGTTFTLTFPTLT
jgi:heavy metal sensor kinase